MRQGGWPRNLVPQLRGKRLGLIGTGLIGREVAAMGRASVWRWSPGRSTRTPTSRFPGLRYIPLEELLQTRTSSPCTCERRRIRSNSSPRAPGMLKAGAFLVNTARGASLMKPRWSSGFARSGLPGPASTSSRRSPCRPATPDHAAERPPHPHCGGMTPTPNLIGLAWRGEIENF